MTDASARARTPLPMTFDQLAEEMIAALQKPDGGGTWSLHRLWPTAPTEGFLVSAPLMSFSRVGVPAKEEVISWIWMNRLELTNGGPFRWRREIAERYSSSSPPVHVPATAYRAAHEIQYGSELFFPGAWRDGETCCLDANMWYAKEDSGRASVNALGWGQLSYRDLASDKNIDVVR